MMTSNIVVVYQPEVLFYVLEKEILKMILSATVLEDTGKLVWVMVRMILTSSAFLLQLQPSSFFDLFHA